MSRSDRAAKVAEMAASFVESSLRGDNHRLSGIPDPTLKLIAKAAVVMAHEVILHSEAVVAADNPKDIAVAH